MCVQTTTFLYVYISVYIYYIYKNFVCHLHKCQYIYIYIKNKTFLNELYFYYGFFQTFEGTEDTIPFQNNSILMISFIFSCFERKLYFS